jgi:hypothetical protein
MTLHEYTNCLTRAYYDSDCIYVCIYTCYSSILVIRPRPEYVSSIYNTNRRLATGLPVEKSEGKKSSIGCN